jgi:uncharacterized protein (TIGR00255 family)
MSVYSMTGFASGQIRGEQAVPPGAETHLAASTLHLEIRSVNSRFLDLSFRLSEDLRGFEPQLREQLGRALRRGKVEVRAFVDHSSQAGLAEPSVHMLQRLSALQDKVQDWLPQAQALSVADALRFSATETAPQMDWQAPLNKLADQVLADLMQARRREGARLADMLQDRVQQLRQLAQQAEPLIPQLVQQQRQRFLDRWNEALRQAEAAISSEAALDRALTEATAFAIRIDVAEELTRLTAHLDELQALLKKGGEMGKRTDFLIQELHREANTLGSKSAALELTRVALDMKVLIEQMREQVQNIE